MEKDLNVFYVGSKLVKLQPIKWEEIDFNPDEVLDIDIFNIIGEMKTLPVFINRMGLLAAEVRMQVKNQVLQLKISEAVVRKNIKVEYAEKGLKKLTIQELEDELLTSKYLQEQKEELINNEYFLDKVEKIEKAAIEKSFNVKSIANKLHPEEFENNLIEGVVNTVLIKIKKSKKN